MATPEKPLSSDPNPLYAQWLATPDIEWRINALPPKKAKQLKEETAAFVASEVATLEKHFAKAREIASENVASIEAYGAALVEVLQGGIDKIKNRVAAAAKEGATIEDLQALNRCTPTPGFTSVSVYTHEHKWDITASPFFAAPEACARFHATKQAFQKKLFGANAASSTYRTNAVDYKCPTISLFEYVAQMQKKTAVEEHDVKCITNKLNAQLTMTEARCRGTKRKSNQ